MYSGTATRIAIHKPSGKLLLGGQTWRAKVDNGYDKQETTGQLIQSKLLYLEAINYPWI